MKKFGCVSCGICCTKIGTALANQNNLPPFEKDAIKDFPFAVQPDGSCSKLVEGKCTVYDKRPLICNMDAMYNKYYRPANIAKDWYFNTSAAACNMMLEAANKEERVKYI